MVIILGWKGKWRFITVKASVCIIVTISKYYNNSKRQMHLVVSFLYFCFKTISSVCMWCFRFSLSKAPSNDLSKSSGQSTKSFEIKISMVTMTINRFFACFLDNKHRGRKCNSHGFHVQKWPTLNIISTILLEHFSILRCKVKDKDFPSW